MQPRLRGGCRDPVYTPATRETQIAGIDVVGSAKGSKPSTPTTFSQEVSMTLTLKDAIELQERNIIGIPLRRAENADLLSEIQTLKESLVARDEMIDTLRQQLGAWQTRSSAEMRAREVESRAAFDRERQLVTVIHRQLTEMQAVHQRELARTAVPATFAATPTPAPVPVTVAPGPQAAPTAPPWIPATAGAAIDDGIDPQQRHRWFRRP
jgi:hypothetical protein